MCSCWWTILPMNFLLVCLELSYLMYLVWKISTYNPLFIPEHVRWLSRLGMSAFLFVSAVWFKMVTLGISIIASTGCPTQRRLLEKLKGIPPRRLVKLYPIEVRPTKYLSKGVHRLGDLHVYNFTYMVLLTGDHRRDNFTTEWGTYELLLPSEIIINEK